MTVRPVTVGPVGPAHATPATYPAACGRRGASTGTALVATPAIATSTAAAAAAAAAATAAASASASAAAAAATAGVAVGGG